MKSPFHRSILCASVIGLLAVTGCNTVSTSSNQYLGVPVYPPSNPAQVEILRAPPSRPNVQLGEVTAEPSSDSVPVQQIEASLRSAAAKLGADAVVIVSDQNQVTGAMVTGSVLNRSVQRITSRVITATAIKYK